MCVRGDFVDPTALVSNRPEFDVEMKSWGTLAHHEGGRKEKGGKKKREEKREKKGKRREKKKEGILYGLILHD